MKKPVNNHPIPTGKLRLSIDRFPGQKPFNDGGASTAELLGHVKKDKRTIIFFRYKNWSSRSSDAGR